MFADLVVIFTAVILASIVIVLGITALVLLLVKAVGVC